MSNAPPPDASPPNARTEPTPLPMPLSPPAASHELDAPVDQAEASNRLNDRDLGNLEASAAVVKADDASEAGYSMSVSASAVPTADAEPKEKKKKKKDKAKQGKEENGEKDKEKEFKPRFPNGKTVLLIRHGELVASLVKEPRIGIVVIGIESIRLMRGRRDVRGRGEFF